MENGTDGDRLRLGGSEALAALRLMRLALPLLDRAGLRQAATHLQQAVDLSGGDAGPTTDAEMTDFLDGMA